MGLLLAASRVYVPVFVRKRRLAVLFRATADAFRLAVPSLDGLSYADSLKAYAQFTAEQAEKAIRSGSSREMQSRLFQNARHLGQLLKAEFKIETPEEVMQLGSVVYRILAIEFKGDPRGCIVIKRCFFSDYYSLPVCRFISALDEGLLNGLSGGGRLSFSRRITEGHADCMASLSAAGEKK